MYRIELSPNEEIVLRTIEELAVAIRRNVVTSRARIWHNASNKWLPIQFHPHYKTAASMPLTQADLVAGPRVTPLSTLNLSDALVDPPTPVSSSREAATQAALAAWPAPKPPAKPAPQVPQPAKQVPPPAPRKPLAPEPQITLGTPAPEPRRVVQPARVAEPPRAQPPRVVEPVRPAPARAKGSRKRQKPGRSLHLALAGAVLAACAQLVISASSSPRSEIAGRIRTPRRLIEASIEAMKEDSPRTVAGVLPNLQTIPLPRKPASSSRAPKPPAAAPRPTATVPDPQAVIPAADSASTEIQPAPAAGDMPFGVPAAPAGGTSRMLDSTGKKALNQILRTIEGTPAPESKTPKPKADR